MSTDMGGDSMSSDKLSNGWTQKELADYLHERAAAQQQLIDPKSAFRQLGRQSDVQNHRYNPHRWRG